MLRITNYCKNRSTVLHTLIYIHTHTHIYIYILHQNKRKIVETSNCVWHPLFHVKNNTINPRI